MAADVGVHAGHHMLSQVEGKLLLGFSCFSMWGSRSLPCTLPASCGEQPPVGNLVGGRQLEWCSRGSRKRARSRQRQEQ